MVMERWARGVQGPRERNVSADDGQRLNLWRLLIKVWASRGDTDTS